MVFDGVKQVLWLINDGRKTYSEMTKADVDRMGGQMSDAMARMQEQLKSLPPQSEGRRIVGTPEDQGFSGVPVRRISFRNGQQQSTTEISEVRRQTFPASTFELPAGFRKEAFGGGRGRP